MSSNPMQTSGPDVEKGVGAIAPAVTKQPNANGLPGDSAPKKKGRSDGELSPERACDECLDKVCPAGWKKHRNVFCSFCMFF